MTNTLTTHQQHLVMYSQGVEDSALRVGMILPGSNEFTTEQDIEFIVAYRAAEQETKSGKAPPHPAPTYRAPLVADPPEISEHDSPYPPDPASGNTGDVPTAGGVYAPVVGSAVLNKQLLTTLLTNCLEHMGPFTAGSVPPGLAWALSAEEAAWLNEHYSYGA